MCESGLHASLDPYDALKYAQGETLCLVECSGRIIHDRDKLVCAERTILARMHATPLLIEFARLRALSCVHLWDPPGSVLSWLMGDETARSAAESAAASASESAAASAARSAAESDAWAAARSASESAAASAAWAAAESAAEVSARSAVRSAARSAAESAAFAAESAAWAAARSAARSADRSEFNELVKFAFQDWL